ncbi:SDR family oxidoreductase [Swaminathania salitolerans]|uniref:Ribitol 2-dehydrogenase n=1 Tax=Swaminathania salitolerans TaxID=182838 RepID=A0A511BQA6_9PROT|nr:SDR family oxidoreductase [Swaminathania salitolerans]GBQ11550.1 putative short-chain alcohol dehydrogenase [Swaminathania salitolerans LMG 21291]GEL02527.1 ribitol 2-dehydrogenase [Swaminathania salitolerans]
MSLSLQNRIAAVTGGASGIGLECVRQLVAAGAIVYILDRDKAAMERARAELGDRVHAVEVDLFRHASIQQAVDTVLDAEGRLDIMFANAGSYVGGNAWEGDPDSWDRMLNLNINAAFHSARVAMVPMIRQGSGDIVITSSVAGVVPIVAEPIYTGSKHAIQAFTHTCRRQLAPHGVRIGAIQPGPVVTPLIDDWDPDRRKAALEGGGMMQPSDVAEALIFMLTRRKGTVVRDLVLLPEGFDI